MADRAPARPPEVAREDLPLRDLHDLVRLGAERAEGLLAPAEAATVRTLLALEGPPGRLFARWTARRPPVFRVGDRPVPGVLDPEAAADALVEAGLVLEGATWMDRLAWARVDELRPWCRAAGVATTGRRGDLQARLQRCEPVPPAARWVTVGPGRLVRRLERLALLEAEADRGLLVAERLGHVRWPDYIPTPGPRLFRDRAHLLGWEETLEALLADRLTVEAALEALRSGHADAPGGLSLRRRRERQIGRAHV